MKNNTLEKINIDLKYNKVEVIGNKFIDCILEQDEDFLDFFYEALGEKIFTDLLPGKTFTSKSEFVEKKLRNKDIISKHIIQVFGYFLINKFNKKKLKTDIESNLDNIVQNAIKFIASSEENFRGFIDLSFEFSKNAYKKVLPSYSNVVKTTKNNVLEISTKPEKFNDFLPSAIFEVSKNMGETITDYRDLLPKSLYPWFSHRLGVQSTESSFFSNVAKYNKAPITKFDFFTKLLRLKNLNLDIQIVYDYILKKSKQLGKSSNSSFLHLSGYYDESSTEYKYGFEEKKGKFEGNFIDKTLEWFLSEKRNILNGNDDKRISFEYLIGEIQEIKELFSDDFLYLKEKDLEKKNSGNIEATSLVQIIKLYLSKSNLGDYENITELHHLYATIKKSEHVNKIEGGYVVKLNNNSCIKIVLSDGGINCEFYDKCFPDIDALIPVSKLDIQKSDESGNTLIKDDVSSLLKNIKRYVNLSLSKNGESNDKINVKGLDDNQIDILASNIAYSIIYYMTYFDSKKDYKYLFDKLLNSFNFSNVDKLNLLDEYDLQVFPILIPNYDKKLKLSRKEILETALGDSKIASMPNINSYINSNDAEKYLDISYDEKLDEMIYNDLLKRIDSSLSNDFFSFIKIILGNKDIAEKSLKSNDEKVSLTLKKKIEDKISSKQKINAFGSAKGYAFNLVLISRFYTFCNKNNIEFSKEDLEGIFDRIGIKKLFISMSIGFRWIENNIKNKGSKDFFDVLRNKLEAEIGEVIVFNKNLPNTETIYKLINSRYKFLNFLKNPVREEKDVDDVEDYVFTKGDQGDKVNFNKSKSDIEALMEKLRVDTKKNINEVKLFNKLYLKDPISKFKKYCEDLDGIFALLDIFGISSGSYKDKVKKEFTKNVIPYIEKKYSVYKVKVVEYDERIEALDNTLKSGNPCHNETIVYEIECLKSLKEATIGYVEYFTKTIEKYFPTIGINLGKNSFTKLPQESDRIGYSSKTKKIRDNRFNSNYKDSEVDYYLKNIGNTYKIDNDELKVKFDNYKVKLKSKLKFKSYYIKLQSTKSTIHDIESFINDYLNEESFRISYETSEQVLNNKDHVIQSVILIGRKGDTIFDSEIILDYIEKFFTLYRGSNSGLKYIFAIFKFNDYVLNKEFKFSNKISDKNVAFIEKILQKRPSMGEYIKKSISDYSKSIHGKRKIIDF